MPYADVYYSPTTTAHEWAVWPAYCLNPRFFTSLADVHLYLAGVIE